MSSADEDDLAALLAKADAGAGEEFPIRRLESVFNQAPFRPPKCVPQFSDLHGLVSSARSTHARALSLSRSLARSLPCSPMLTRLHTHHPSRPSCSTASNRIPRTHRHRYNQGDSGATAAWLTAWTKHCRGHSSCTRCPNGSRSRSRSPAPGFPARSVRVRTVLYRDYRE